MKTAIEIIGMDNCTGCFGCYNSCPIENAIEMKYDKEGFYKPFITNNCIHCGKCSSFCPVIKKENNNKVINSYGSWTKNEEILLNSSSGGIFSELAIEILKESGIVYGVAWENGKVKHTRIEKMEELYKLRGSKYLPSYVGNSYKDVLEDLKENKKVLFSGTPCQIGALNKLVKDKNLITVDLICHGIPSYRAYEKYCNEEFYEVPNKVDFRSKTTGWINYSLFYYINNKIKNNYHYMDKFFCGFLKNIYLNKPCYSCLFRGTEKGENREADITLADFWGVPKKLFNKNGVSLVIINNQKGKEFFEKIKNNIFCEEISLSTGIKGNLSFYKNFTVPKERDEFYKNFEKMTFNELSDKYFRVPTLLERKIKRIVFFPIRCLLYILRKLGIKK